MQQKDASTHSSFSFPKKERLCSRLAIENLVDKKQTLFCYPFKCYYDFAAAQTEPLPQMAISVPKRLVKSAVKRNLVKRRVREAYRLNKSPLLQYAQQTKTAPSLLFIFVGKEIPSYNFLQDKIIVILKRLISINH